jgi:hypothetical protein
LQLKSYGADRGGFYNEGELSDVEDSTYVRRATLVKYMQVTGAVTLQAQMVRSFQNALKSEIKNKMLWILRLANRSMTTADSDIITQEFDGIYKQHASIGTTGEFLYSTPEQYFGSDVVYDMRGKSLKQTDVEEGAVIVDQNYGVASVLYAPTGVISGLSADYYGSQRILMDGSKGFSGTAGISVKAITTTLGDVNLVSDKFLKSSPPKNPSAPSTSSAAPAPPQSVTAALVADEGAKFDSDDEGTVYYAVSSLNRKGESALTVFATAVNLAAGQRVDLSIVDGTSANPTVGYQIYRSKKTAASSAALVEFYPIFRVGKAQQLSGYHGASAGKIADKGFFMPDTEQAFLTEMSEEVMSFKQLAPISKLDLAVTDMSRKFITFLFGTPQVYAPKKLVRFINIGNKK